MAEMADGQSAGTLGEQAIAAVDSGEVQPGVDSAAATDADGGGSVESSDGVSHEGHTADELSDLERFFSDDEKPAEADDGSGEKSSGGSRAEKRIRALNSRLKEQAQRNDQLAQHMQQMQQMHQRELSMLREQNARFDERFKTFGQQQQEPDPVAQFKADVLSEARKQVGGELSPQIQQALQRIDAYEQQRESDRRTSEIRANATRLNQMADAAVDKYIVPKVGEVDPGERDFLASMVIATKGMRRVDVDSAAKIVRAQLNAYARKSIRTAYKARGDKLRESQKSAETTPTGRGGATGDSYPSWDKLRAAGFRSYHQWEIRGKPQIP